MAVSNPINEGVLQNKLRRIFHVGYEGRILASDFLPPVEITMQDKVDELLKSGKNFYLTVDEYMELQHEVYSSTTMRYTIGLSDYSNVACYINKYAMQGSEIVDIIHTPKGILFRLCCPYCGDNKKGVKDGLYNHKICSCCGAPVE